MTIDESIAAVQAMLFCRHPKTTAGWNLLQGGQRQLRKQCDVCGALVGPVMPARDAPPGTPQVNVEARDESESRYDQLEQLRAEKNARWWADYDHYLTTPEWREKADAVARQPCLRGMRQAAGYAGSSPNLSKCFCRIFV